MPAESLIRCVGCVSHVHMARSKGRRQSNSGFSKSHVARNTPFPVFRAWKRDKLVLTAQSAAPQATVHTRSADKSIPSAHQLKIWRNAQAVCFDVDCAHLSLVQHARSCFWCIFRDLFAPHYTSCLRVHATMTILRMNYVLATDTMALGRAAVVVPVVNMFYYCLVGRSSILLHVFYKYEATTRLTARNFRREELFIPGCG
jgi:hypothetical protein